MQHPIFLERLLAIFSLKPCLIVAELLLGVYVVMGVLILVLKGVERCLRKDRRSQRDEGEGIVEASREGGGCRRDGEDASLLLPLPPPPTYAVVRGEA